MNHRGSWFCKPGRNKVTSAGTVRRYRNSAEQGASPKYALSLDLQCADWDEDGDYDILSGWFFGGVRRRATQVVAAYFCLRFF